MASGRGVKATGGKRSECLREQYPMIFAFGEGPIAYLSHEQSIAAPVADRIKSVWPFLVRQVLRFADTLKARDAANYDPEDVLGELWIALVEKDDKWDPTRGRYLTFAGRVVTNELHAIRDRSHTVHAPKNTSCRLKQYETEDHAGGLSPRRRKTFGDILRVLGEQEAFDSDPESMSAPAAVDVAVRREETRIARDALKFGLQGLSPRETAVLGRAFGLFGRHESPIAEIAVTVGLTVETVKKIKSRAMSRVQARIRATGFPNP